MAYKDFTEMAVWQKGFKLLLKVYEVTKAYPKEEKYGLVSDMRRAANSVTNNISEGFGRYEKLDKTRFYKISRGSCYELTIGYRNVIADLDPIIKSIETTIRK